MINHPNLLRILPMTVFVIFLLVDETWQQLNSEDIIKYFSNAPLQRVRINQCSTTTTIEVGSDLKIFCSVEGYPMPTVDWYKNGQIIRNSERTQVIEHELVIFHANLLDSGSYICSAYNEFSSDSRTVNVTIYSILAKRDEDKNIVAKAILSIALVQIILLSLAFCLIKKLINQRNKDEKLKVPMNLNATLNHQMETI